MSSSDRGSILEQGKDTVSGVYEQGKNMVSSVYEQGTDTVSSVLEQGKDTVTSTGQSIANAVGLESDAHKAGRTTGEAVSGTATSTGNAVKGAVDGGAK